jgi:hypothetical protein
MPPLTAAVRYLSGEREPVRVATTGNITLQGLQVIDDVDLEVGDRVLVKDQTDQKQNGIWLASEGRWPRAPDAAYTRAINKGVTVNVQEGSQNNGKAYRFATETPSVGVDPIVVEFFLSATYTSDIEGARDAAVLAIAQERDSSLSSIEGATADSLSTIGGAVETAVAPYITEAAMYAEMVGAAVYDFNFDSDPSTPGYDWND